MKEIAVNTRSLASQLTGAQRVTAELVTRLSAHVDAIAPSTMGRGASGHLWEQTVLPWRVRRRLLWSPSNTGPLAVPRQVLTVLDLAALDHPEWFGSRFASWYGWLLPRLVHRVKRIVAISEFTKRRLVERLKVPKEKVAVVFPGVDPRFSPRPSNEVREALAALGVPSEEYVLTLGSLEPRKNLSELLEAWAKLEGLIPANTWLVIAGGAGASHVFQRQDLTQISNRVYFTGYVDDRYLPALYAGAKAFVYPSTYEGFGLPPLEAMASGTPVIVGTAKALSEVCGDAGLSVSDAGADSLAILLKRVMEDEQLQRTLRAEGLQRARLFTWDRAAESFLNVLLEERVS